MEYSHLGSDRDLLLKSGGHSIPPEMLYSRR